MSIMRPSLEQQVAPAPWLVSRHKADVPAMIRKIHTEQPDLNVDGIVCQLGRLGVQVSGIIVCMWVQKLRQETALASMVNNQSAVAA